jgi:hypothetical protein
MSQTDEGDGGDPAAAPVTMGFLMELKNSMEKSTAAQIASLRELMLELHVNPSSTAPKATTATAANSDETIDVENLDENGIPAKIDKPKVNPSESASDTGSKDNGKPS